MDNTAYLLVNFGGPRDLNEIEEFLISLLTDQEVIRTPFPAFFHKLLFTRVAKKRSKKIAPDYELIGGKSPIYEDTEAVAERVGKRLNAEVITFHRYLPKTHAAFIKKLESLRDVQRIRVFPMFPQFSYATTGSIALWFSKHLSAVTVDKLQWIKSYPGQDSYIDSMDRCLRDFLNEKGLKEEETVLLFSAHGLPQRFICTGDDYEKECRLSFQRLSERFPGALARLSFQSQFGKEPWIRPYTAEVCERMSEWSEGRKNAVVIPLSFTSDHIETLYEIEELYIGSIRKSGMQAYRCPALNRREDWINTVAKLFQDSEGMVNAKLIRKDTGKCCRKPGACKLAQERGSPA
ncbi:MAG: ferrochelatase [Verrucomicrobia bacterium]|nr:ferrochelatase [Verrucomicrobiota bacterium]